MGVDLGTSASMSGAAGYWPETGALDAFAAFPELPTLQDRGRADNVGPLYSHCYRRGEIITAGQRVSDIGVLLTEALQRWGVPALVMCDRWRAQELREKLDAVGFPVTGLEVRGMGFKDGAEDVRDFRAACLSDAVKPRQSLLLRSCIKEARTISDPAGNSKLAKGKEGGRRRSTARDDAIAAADALL